MPIVKAEAQCRATALSPPPRHGGRRGWWGQARPMGAVSHQPHARARQHRTLGKPLGQIPSQHQMSGEWMPNEWWVESGKWQVASGKWWGVRFALWLVNGKMNLHVWVYVYETTCWLSVSVTPSVFGPIRPEWTGQKQSRPVQSRSRKIGDWSDPGPNISWTGPGLDWTVPVRTGPLLDWWNHWYSLDWSDDWYYWLS